MASSSRQGTGNDLTFFLSQIAREADVDSNDQILESRNSKICLYLEAAVPIFGQLLDLREEVSSVARSNFTMEIFVAVVTLFRDKITQPGMSTMRNGDRMRAISVKGNSKCSLRC